MILSKQSKKTSDMEDDIKKVDEKLSILRESWLDSKPEKKPTWMSKINAALDERLKLMKIRDKDTQ
jgi:hypothetical protein